MAGGFQTEALRRILAYRIRWRAAWSRSMVDVRVDVSPSRLLIALSLHHGFAGHGYVGRQVTDIGCRSCGLWRYRFALSGFAVRLALQKLWISSTGSILLNLEKMPQVAGGGPLFAECRPIPKYRHVLLTVPILSAC